MLSNGLHIFQDDQNPFTKSKRNKGTDKKHRKGQLRKEGNVFTKGIDVGL